MDHRQSALDYMGHFEIGEIVEIITDWPGLPAEVTKGRGVITQKFNELGYSETPAVEILAEGEKRIYRLDSIRKISSDA